MKKVLLSLALISAFGLNNSWSQCTASLTVSTNINGEIVGVDNSFGAASISWSVFQQPWNYYFSDTTSGLSCYPPTSGTYYVCVTDWAGNQTGWCDSACTSIYITVPGGGTGTTCGPAMTLSEGPNGEIIGTNSSTGATSYDWVVYSGGFNIETTASTTDLSYTPQIDGTYDVCLTAYDTLGNWCDSVCSSIAINTDTTTGTTCTPDMTLSAGSNGEVIGTNMSTGATSYEWIIYTSGFNFIASETTTDLNFPLLFSGEYDVCLTAYDSLGNWCDSTCSSIYINADSTTGAACDPAMTLTEGPNGEIIGTNSSTGATSYDWVVYSGGFNVVATENTTDLSYTPQMDGTYDVCLTAYDTLGNWCDSVCSSIVISTDTVIFSGLIEGSNATSIDLYPNPVKDRLNLVFDSEMSSKVTIIIVDMLGKQLDYSVHSSIADGEIIEFNMNNVPTGVYSVIINSEDGLTIRRFTKK